MFLTCSIANKCAFSMAYNPNTCSQINRFIVYFLTNFVVMSEGR